MSTPQEFEQAPVRFEDVPEIVVPADPVWLVVRNVLVALPLYGVACAAIIGGWL